MANQAKKECIFCSVPTEEYVPIENIHIDILNVLLINTDIEKSEQAIFCNECSEQLLELFAFKSMYLHTEDLLTTFTDYENNEVLDIANVFLRKYNNAQEKLILLNKTICRICIRPVESMSFTPLADIDARDLKMLQEYMPEINVDIVKEPIVCETCFMCFKEYFAFVNKCLSIFNSKGSNGDNVKSTSLDGKVEKGKEKKTINKTTKRKNKKNSILECNKCDFKTKWHASLYKHSLRHADPQNAYKCNYCDFKTIYKQAFKQHKQQHEECSFVLKKIQCPLCNYRTKTTSCLKTHMLTHKTLSNCQLYKCDKCPFQTKHKSALTYHKVIHEDLPLLKCMQCTYETKHKRSLDAHKLTHNKNRAYACDKCGFKSSTKNYLFKHMQLHREKTLDKMHRCDSCPYETKIACQLKTHRKVHETPSETYKCKSCSFETRYKACLARHQTLTHGKGDIPMFKCEVCPFESKYKSGLKMHSLTHRNVEDLPVIKCPLCDFQTVRARSMKSHALKHKDEAEVKMFECDKCSFRSRYRLALTNHIVIHSGVLHKCNLCSYQTLHKRNFAGHYKVMHKVEAETIAKEDRSKVENRKTNVE